MNPTTVRTELADRLKTIDGLRTHAFPPGKVITPAAILQPQKVDYGLTYGRGGMAQLELGVIVVTGKPADRSSHERLDAYAAGEGDRSIKAVLETGEYTAFHDVTVSAAEWDVIPIGGVDYLAALFTLKITGSGA